MLQSESYLSDFGAGPKLSPTCSTIVTNLLDHDWNEILRTWNGIRKRRRESGRGEEIKDMVEERNDDDDEGSERSEQRGDRRS